MGSMILPAKQPERMDRNFRGARRRRISFSVLFLLAPLGSSFTPIDHRIYRSCNVWSSVSTSPVAETSGSQEDEDPSQPSPSPQQELPPTPPLSPTTFAGMVEQGLLKKFGANRDGGLDRVLTSWRLLEQGYVHNAYIGAADRRGATDAATSNSYQESHSYFPGLTVQEFWNDQQPSWCGKLAQAYPQIRKELDSVLSNKSLQQQGTNVWAGALSDDAAAYGPGWKTLVLMNRGLWDATNVRDLFPVTSRILQSLPDLPAVEIFFARMDPQSAIQTHSDFTSFVLTCHLGLDIPTNGDCTITVGDTEVAWENGKVLLFDTSILHHAKNESPDHVRYILMLRVWHPDLTPIEREALQFIYDVLEFPDLIADDDTARRKAEQELATAKSFPLVQKGGFGAGAGGATSRPRNKKAKRKKR